ncbi:MAG TPA: sigma 54-interacting transcriptional regulator [Candidatus Acidoferrum sp.]|jgi:transcriptional regulator with GAF, ATPase, and Fis domain|nr:sigma 54-interacting transcriptional regulator [Candidatus Acidoferrum sp.]
MSAMDSTLQTLHQCHRALLRATDENELLRSICWILVEVGGFRMVWVGYRQYDAQKSIRPVAHAGFENGYLAAVSATWANDERGQGPSGMALRTGKPAWAKIIREEESFAPWREHAIAQGYASSLALPLSSDANTFGVLSLYSAETGQFNENTFERYVEFADNLAFGIVTIRTREDRKKADQALQKAFEEIKALKDKLYEENLALREEVDQASMFEEIIGTSPALQEVLSRVAKVAPSDSTVLITGETGTGKELVARAIHKRSQRADRAFVSVNCAAIPSSLIASELFGHEKGAFTGALQRRIGRFEFAEGGTLFLDEVGELPAETQVALLRVLQEREFERVGSSQPISSNVRVIAATNRNLGAAVAAGTFRSDLFYRLNVFPIDVPPLRRRPEDIPLLVNYFIGRYSEKVAKKITSIEKRSLELFSNYSWPGNIRELQNVIERSVILSESGVFAVDESWFAAQPAAPDGSSASLNKRILDQEREMIEAALALSNGRVSGTAGAAAKLGIPASTLESKIKTLGIKKTKFKTA